MVSRRKKQEHEAVFPSIGSALFQGVKQGRVGGYSGVTANAQPWFVVEAARILPARTWLVVVPSAAELERWSQDLNTWLEWAWEEESRRPELLVFPAWDVLPQENRLPRADIIGERLAVLDRLVRREAQDRPLLLLAEVRAVMQKTLAPEYVKQHLLFLEEGTQIGPLELSEWLERQGYEQEVKVTGKGEYARRGGILDVFPSDHEQPVRIEFFGDTIDSIRTFDVETQRTTQRLKHVLLGPGGELVLLRRWAEQQQGAGPDSERSDWMPDGGTWDGVSGKEEAELPSPMPLYTYLQDLRESVGLVLVEPEQIWKEAERYLAEIPKDQPLIEPWPDWIREAGRQVQHRIELQEAQLAGAFHSEAASIPLSIVDLEAYRAIDVGGPMSLDVLERQRRRLFEQMHRWMRQGMRVYVVCGEPTERDRFLELWREMGWGGEEEDSAAEGDGPETDSSSSEAVGDRLVSAESPSRNRTGPSQSLSRSIRPLVRLGRLSGGFLWEEGKVVVVTDVEIFGRKKVLTPRALRSKIERVRRASVEVHFAELEPGDYVVHVQYGIGRFVGLGRLDGGEGEECLVIEYAPTRAGDPPDRLYVPITQAHLVTKYVGTGRGRPQLDRLRSPRWRRTRAKAEQAIRDFAAELLRIQALRAMRPGFACPPDTPWQRDFENAFPYEETPDQLAAIEATKRDMESSKPMDRLICGDVGFGKTEVAIRAAFKMVMAGKQVAILAPTTVLAHQHYRTFQERMAGYPIRIELLSRFRSRAQQERILRDLALGSVDIVIGTHRLLSDDVQFHDLGLVVIDEEQRFGVAHKERLKQLRCEVDVLTLSATPIPRTLYLALAGARDMSVIETPPQDRLPVETIVAAYDEDLVRRAIERELARGGQVFYLHNRVARLPLIAERLRMLVPKARIEVAHGQMPSDQLERVMTRFVNGEVDVLVCTTIIESGLDIPNANTIIIERADRFGLSDLYQLRGRVGRYKHQAYAYLLIPRHARVLDTARKRLSAIRQYSAPGSGFKIALKDLEIRGAGNLLGKEQSGHISAVGFELYCRLLEETIRRLKGEEVRRPPQVRIALDFLRVGASGGERSDAAVAALPTDYVTEPSWRIEVHRRLAEAVDPQQIADLEEELRDRFGPLPHPVRYLLEVYRLKMLAAERGVTAIEVRENRLMLVRGGDYLQVRGRFPRLSGRTVEKRLREIRQYLEALQPAYPRGEGQPVAQASRGAMTKPGK